MLVKKLSSQNFIDLPWLLDLNLGFKFEFIMFLQICPEIIVKYYMHHKYVIPTEVSSI